MSLSDRCEPDVVPNRTSSRDISAYRRADNYAPRRWGRTLACFGAATRDRPCYLCHGPRSSRSGRWRACALEIQTSDELDRFFSVFDPWGYEGNGEDDRRVAQMLSALPELSFDRVLDVGCGSGYLTVCLPGRKVVGIDLSPNAVHWAVKRAQRCGLSHVAFEVGSIFELSAFSQESFDLIVVTGVLYRQYIGHASVAVMDGLMRLLKPGGHLVHAHIEEWFELSFPMSRIERKTYPYRDYFHLVEVYRK